MTPSPKGVISPNEYSPAEIILGLMPKQLLRLSFDRIIMDGRVKWTELYIWICPKTNFFRGLYDLSGDSVKPMSEEPLNSKQLLSHINETSFQAGSDLIEIIPNIQIDDLKSLFLANEAAA